MNYTAPQVIGAALAVGLLLRPGTAYGVISDRTDNEELIRRIGPIRRGQRYLETSAQVAESLLGIQATEGHNRGPEVDEISAIMGRPQSGSGSPWCSKFSTTVAILASDISGKDTPDFEGSSSVARIWHQNNPNGLYGDNSNFTGRIPLGIPRDSIKDAIRNGWNPRGAMMLRSRLSASSADAAAIFEGSTRQGHALIIVGHRLDDDGRLTLWVIGGNTVGPDGGGSVWHSEVEEGDSSWDRVVGIVVPHAPSLPR